MMVELKLNPLLSLSDTFNAIKFGENNEQATQQDNLHSKDDIACNRIHYIIKLQTACWIVRVTFFVNDFPGYYVITIRINFVILQYL